jgi:phage terminase large subunit-like protein
MASIKNLKMDQDPAGNLKPNKAKSTGKIDPAVSFIMAGSMALQSFEERAATVSVGFF